jgi:hypothetical protein
MKGKKLIKFLGKVVAVASFAISIFFFFQSEFIFGFIFLLTSLFAYGGLEDKYIKLIDKTLPVSLWVLSILLIIMGANFAIIKDWKFALISVICGVLVCPKIKMHYLAKSTAILATGVLVYYLS